MIRASPIGSRPSGSRKLRATKTDDNVLLLKTNMGAGHGGKSGRFESLNETAEDFALHPVAVAREPCRFHA